MAKPDDPMPSLEELQRKIDAIQPNNLASQEDSSGAQYGKGVRMGVDLLAGAGVGIFLGYYLDKAAGTTPLFLLLFLFLGFAAGVRNIMRNVE
ncbi:MAG: AtpZ/AtpI family protein [Alphaproteobacteria bacterium]